MSLKRMARFTVLYHQSQSLCQAVARFSLEMSSAEYQYNIFFPSLAKEIAAIIMNMNLYRRVAQDPDNDHVLQHESDIGDFDQMKTVWEEMGGDRNMAFNRVLPYRPRLAYHFPSRIEVPTIAVPVLRFLNYASFDYRD